MAENQMRFIRRQPWFFREQNLAIRATHAELQCAAENFAGG